MKTGHTKNLRTNPSSIKTRFAIRFLQAMNKLNKNNRSSAPSSMAADKYKRYHIIKAAACASMASAVGRRRAWSRALLKKIRNRTLHQLPVNRNRNRRKRDVSGNPREDDLRRLVPGGEAMGSCRLLSETGHYIKCLRAQVEVMANMLEHYSA